MKHSLRPQRRARHDYGYNFLASYGWVAGLTLLIFALCWYVEDFSSAIAIATATATASVTNCSCDCIPRTKLICYRH